MKKKYIMCLITFIIIAIISFVYVNTNKTNNNDNKIKIQLSQEKINNDETLREDVTIESQISEQEKIIKQMDNDIEKIKKEKCELEIQISDIQTELNKERKLIYYNDTNNISQTKQDNLKSELQKLQEKISEINAKISEKQSEASKERKKCNQLYEQYVSEMNNVN